jgi:protein tyrosine phosphatase (PTP) superfamily phosphohydrolase (DUF442 family)
MALFMALLCKKPDDEEDDRPAHLRPNQDWLSANLTSAHDPETARWLQRMQYMPMELDQDIVKAAREKRWAWFHCVMHMNIRYI